jgi:exopolysaccharide biosynthesis protein
MGGDMRTKRLIFVAAAFLAAVNSFAFAQPIVKEIAPGVILTQDIQTDPRSPLIVNCVSVDLSNPTVQIKAALARDAVMANDATKGREIVSNLTARAGATVGINADFFPFTGDPLGVCIVDGELVSEPAGNRVALAITKQRAVFFDIPRLIATLTTASGAERPVAGINRPRTSSEIVVYTSAFGSYSIGSNGGINLICTSEDLPIRVNTPIRLVVKEISRRPVSTPLPKDIVVVSAGGEAALFLESNVAIGDTVTVRFNIKSANDSDWTDVVQAVGGGPWLLRDGKIWIDTVAEGFSVSGFEKAKHPRTAVGLTADNKLLLVTVDGRQTISAGISLPDLADLMKRLGAVSAINLDGGGSTTLSVKGILINAPSGGVEREIANAILVFAPEPEVTPVSQLVITGLPTEIISGMGIPVELTTQDQTQPMPANLHEKVIWGTRGGIGFVNQKGYFTPVKARKGYVSALYGSLSVDAPVEVLPGPLAKLAAELSEEPSEAGRSILRITALDANGNPVPSKQVSLTVVGGKPDVQCGATNDLGYFETVITWDPNAGQRLVVATSDSLRTEIKPK